MLAEGPQLLSNIRWHSKIQGSLQILIPAPAPTEDGKYQRRGYNESQHQRPDFRPGIRIPPLHLEVIQEFRRYKKYWDPEGASLAAKKRRSSEHPLRDSEATGFEEQAQAG